MGFRSGRSLWALSNCKSNLGSFPSQKAAIARFCSLNSPQIESVGFIGTGNMGRHMVNNLIKAGYQVTVHDTNQKIMEMFADKGVPTSDSPLKVSETSDAVITMLPSPSHVLDVYIGPDGLLRNKNTLRPWLLIDSSTIDPQTSRRLSVAVSNCLLKQKRGAYEKPYMLDAPVSGGVLAAEAGTLTFMVGGAEEVYLASKSLFTAMGKNTIYCGGAGNGSAAKICNNLAMGVSMLGVSEALALGQSLGVKGTTLSKVFNASSARCWSSDTYNPVPGVMEGVPASRDYDGGFASKLMAKDLNFAATSAEGLGLKSPLATQAKHIFTKLCDDGHANKDFSCVFRHYYSGVDEL